MATPAYNPRFVYQPQDKDKIQRAMDTLAALEIPEAGIGMFLERARAYLTQRLARRLQLGLDEAWVAQLYPPAPSRVWTLARAILADPVGPPSNIRRPFGAHHLIKLINARFKEYGLSDWTVEAKPNISSTNTDSANRVITVRSDIQYSLEEMKRLVVHEVDTHVLRSANGALQPFRIMAVGAVPSYLMTEEGLAVINEERMGYVDVARTRVFAGRVLAATRALTESFADVYAEQRDYGFSAEEAFVTTKRVKRGLHDTSSPGGFLKDQAYLWGRVLVEEFVLAGGDLGQLYSGKLAIEHLPMIAQLDLQPARYMPLPYI